MGSDSYDEMHRVRPGADAYDDLLSGRLSPLDAPLPLRGVAALFEAAAGPAAPEELARRSQVVGAVTTEVRSSLPHMRTGPARRRSMLSKVLTAKFAAAATAAAFGLGTAAAAATGSLPGQTSHANSHAATGLATAASHQKSHGAGSTGHHGSSGNSPSGSGSLALTGTANRHAQFGLCTAFLAAGGSQSATSGGSVPSTPPQYNSTAFKALIGEHNGVAGTTTYCHGVVAAHPGSHGDTNDTGKPADAGKPASTGKPAGTGKPADVGPPTSTGSPTGAGKPSGAGTPPSAAGSSSAHPPVSPPTSSGATANPGTSTAGPAGHGAGSAGSGHAPAHP
jgi:hypothetical protein